MEPLYIAGGNVKWYSCCGKQFQEKLNIELLYNPAVILPEKKPFSPLTPKKDEFRGSRGTKVPWTLPSA